MLDLFMSSVITQIAAVLPIDPQQANLQLASDDAVTFVDHGHKAVNISVFIILVNT